MEITQKFRDALTRQANEAVRIYSRPDDELLNSKSEFNHPPMARVVVQNKWRREVPISVSGKFKNQNIQEMIWSMCETTVTENNFFSVQKSMFSLQQMANNSEQQQWTGE